MTLDPTLGSRWSPVGAVREQPANAGASDTEEELGVRNWGKYLNTEGTENYEVYSISYLVYRSRESRCNPSLRSKGGGIPQDSSLFSTQST